MKSTVKYTINNEKGFVLVAALLMVVVVTIIGIAATRTSETEIQISVNEREYVNQFYNTEGALIDTLERPGTWLTTTFLTTPLNSANHIINNVDFNADGTPDADVEIRCIEETGTPISDLRDAANDLPLQKHIAPPPPGSGYSMKYFQVRRYGVTATSATGNTQIQTGVWKVFNKSQ